MTVYDIGIRFCTGFVLKNFSKTYLNRLVFNEFLFFLARSHIWGKVLNMVFAFIRREIKKMKYERIFADMISSVNTHELSFQGSGVKNNFIVFLTYKIIDK